MAIEAAYLRLRTADIVVDGDAHKIFPGVLEAQRHSRPAFVLFWRLLPKQTAEVIAVGDGDVLHFWVVARNVT